MAGRSILQAGRALLAFSALVWLALAQAASERINGSERVIDDVRSIGGYSRLLVQAPLDVRLKRADAERVVVHADDNIAPLVETVERGGVLTIGLRPGASFRTRSKLYVEVQARRMDGIVVRGSGEVRADRIEGAVFDATIQGSGDIRVGSLQVDALAVSIAGNGDFRAAGHAETVGVVIDGAGDVYCEDLQAKQVAVRIRGSGDARVNASDELKVDIDGSGDVRYRGKPKVSKRIGGTGSVEPF